MDFKTWGEEFWSHCDSDMGPEVKALALESGIAELNGYKFNEGDEIPQAVQFVQSWCLASGLKLTDAAMLLVAGLGDRVGVDPGWTCCACALVHNGSLTTTECAEDTAPEVLPCVC